MGASEEEVAAQLGRLPIAAPDEVEPIELDEDAGAAVTLLYALSTQWKWAGMGVRVGLDYAAIEPTARLVDVELNPRIFLDLSVLESEAIGVFAEAARKPAA